MAEEIKKPIASVSINYEDGSREKFNYYALVGYSGDTWYTVMLSPPGRKSKIRMNNEMVVLADRLSKDIGQDK